MATSGVFLDLSKDTLISSLKKNKGIVIDCARDLNCTRWTFLKYVRAEPEALELMNALRSGYDEIVLDMAEDNVVKLLEQCDSTTTFYTLNMRGDKRGWNKDKKPDTTQELNRMIVLEKENADLQAKIAELQAKLPLDHSGSQAASKLLQEAPDKSQSNDPVQS